VIYEIHIGTFTREGTWDAARQKLDKVKEVGVTVVEVLPVADFPGRFGWGYDGVGLFAPVAIYGPPDDFRRFVDQAHSIGLGVILDVVYNHLGPDGNYLKAFSDDYFTDRYYNEWGDAINFDGENADPVREWVTSNAAHWADEYHLDGLRLDATQQIFDSSPEHICAELTRSFRAAARGRDAIIVAEDETQRSRMALPAEHGGFGLDGLWNDDFHHSAIVAVTGRNEAYYSDYQGRPQELISTTRQGFLFQGQRSRWQKKRRGTPAYGMRPEQFITYVQNHDQVANQGFGLRLNRVTSPGRYRAITAFLLLGQGTPMLFQGQEFAASAPFRYFADHAGKLSELVRRGRAKFLSQFPSLEDRETPNPCLLETFEKCKLDWSERETHESDVRLHRDLLQLRRKLPRDQVDGAVLGEECFVLRGWGRNGADWLLFVNLGRDLLIEVAAEPLLAEPEGRGWKLEWSSEDQAYGGAGTPPVEHKGVWHIPGHTSIVIGCTEPSGETRRPAT
jgi:maltooligosyltrehalose trehalohydrolase